MMEGMFEERVVVVALIVQFWLSGSYIMGIIFTQSEDLEDLNMWMFLTLALGSLIGGVLADGLGAVRVFKLYSVMLGFGAGVCLLDRFIGHIWVAGCIGLLNNLTFVLIMNFFPVHKDKYTISVLMGWAFSEITLGTIFSLIDNGQYFYILLFFVCVADTITIFLFLGEVAITTEELQPPQQAWWTRFIPLSWKHLIGGCLIMFVIQMFYYRTQFTLDQFGISLELNTVVVGFMQGFANLVIGCYTVTLPRKLILRILLIFLLSMFLLLMLVSDKLGQTIIEGIMRLGDSGILLILGVYLPELFQASERSKGVNFIMCLGVIGSAMNQKILKNFPFWFLSIFLLIAFISTFLLKETASRSKQEQLSEELSQ